MEASAIVEQRVKQEALVVVLTREQTDTEALILAAATDILEVWGGDTSRAALQPLLTDTPAQVALLAANLMRLIWPTRPNKVLGTASSNIHQYKRGTVPHRLNIPRIRFPRIAHLTLAPREG